MENYQIVKTFCCLPEKTDGWHKELNLISWYGRLPVYDLREWNLKRKMKKGITLSQEELTIIIKSLEEEKANDN